eukprot:c18504_g1_i3 orf=98-391(+)
MSTNSLPVTKSFSSSPYLPTSACISLPSQDAPMLLQAFERQTKVTAIGEGPSSHIRPKYLRATSPSPYWAYPTIKATSHVGALQTLLALLQEHHTLH